MGAGRPLKFKSVKELQEKIDEYFVVCDKEKKPYTVTGLANHLDTNRETLVNYEKRDEFFDTIKRGKSKCEQWVEENAMVNKANATFAIFNLKNNYGWEDRTKVDNTHNLDQETLELIDSALDDV